MKGQWFGQYVSMADTLKIKDLPEPPDASRPYEVLPGGAIRYLDNKDKTRKAK